MFFCLMLRGLKPVFIEVHYIRRYIKLKTIKDEQVYIIFQLDCIKFLQTFLFND